jgi:hypothetical protein
MNDNGKIGMALVGGYLLGRTKKAKLAIGLGMVLAGKKLDLSPQQLLKMAANSPVLGGLSDQVRRDLMDGTKSALTSAVTKRADGLADSLHERTRDLSDPAGRRRRAGEDGEESDEDPPEDEHAADAEDEPGGEEPEERPRPQRKAPAAGRKSAGAAKSAKPAAKSAAAGRSSKSTAKKAAKPASGGRSGGTARKAAASGTRKTTGRGGRDG